MKASNKRPLQAPSSPQDFTSRKVVKVEHDGDPPDYSSDVRKKIQTSNRTGQACDRCRMRKMRCDGRPDGCAPCVQNQTPCKTTDRMTGIANERGHVKRLEQRIKNLEKHIHGLEDRLTSVGEDVKPFDLSGDADVAPLQWHDPKEHQSPQKWEMRDTGPEQCVPFQDPAVLHSAPHRLPDFRSGLDGNNYLGVSSGNSFISSIRGTAMNVLGAEIDLADYKSSDLDEPDRPMFGQDYALNKSYHAFVRTAYSGGSKAQEVGFPPPEEGLKYLRWYIRMVHPYTPFLHKPTFIRMLGRPMPLHEEDFDVELPEPIDDEFLTEDGIDVSRQGKCDFLVAVELCKILPAILDLYRSVYSIRRSPTTYVENVKRLENRFRQWHDQWPQEMKVGDASRDEEGRVHAQYLSIAGLECRLLLRHPSLSLTTVPEFNEENLSVCMDMSRQILRHVKVLQRYKSLDTNWQSGALCILAISTTLFGHWERADSITPSELEDLRQDMSDWLSIIGDVSELLGSGKRLQEAVHVTVEKTLHSLEQHVTSKSGSFALLSTKSTVTSKGTSIGPPTHHGAYGQQSAHLHYSDQTVSASDGAQETKPQNAYQSAEGSNTVTQPAMQYTPSTPYPFLGSASSYASTSDTYVPTAYTPGQPLPSNSQQATPAAANAYLCNSSSPSHSSYDAGISMGYNTGPGLSWREWAGHMAAYTGHLLNQPQQHPEYLNSATGLMQLGGRNDQGDDVNAPAAADLGAMNGSTAHHWPMMIFDDSHPGALDSG
ncbi:MAG: hypothetical protein Q9191_004317 [Dirinaria sp. TL-2023a]